ncbi:unnamed protein product [Paramecium sonneborni]|uniref:Uncharacterized protein n=1 Tax=Paramecium sonneborni TaxID=65129 RepID=A0A8S1RBB8_9CILI|nr:unnamed protein product [Paramecium sonneborni]
MKLIAFFEILIQKVFLEILKLSQVNDLINSKQNKESLQILSCL